MGQFKIKSKISQHTTCAFLTKLTHGDEHYPHAEISAP